MDNIFNYEDKFGKTVGELASAWMTLNEDARRLYGERIDHHTERIVMNLGFPSTGAMLAEMVEAISSAAIGALIVDGYMEVTDKGFAQTLSLFDNETENNAPN